VSADQIGPRADGARAFFGIMGSGGAPQRPARPSAPHGRAL